MWDLCGCVEAPNMHSNLGSPSGYAVDAAANIGSLALQVRLPGAISYHLSSDVHLTLSMFVLICYYGCL
jgi:hypothetical protein